MSTELVNLATSEKLSEMDWSRNIQICELVAEDHRQAKDVISAIKKRLGHKHPNVQVHAVMLLEMLMNNIGGPIYREVVDAGLLDMLVKIVKKKSDLPATERIFLLLDATQTSLGGAKGRFPQYYDAYSELVNAGVQFPQSQHTVSSSTNQTSSTRRQIIVSDQRAALNTQERITPQEQTQPQTAPESSIIKKATAVLEVLREVLNAVDAQNPQAGKDEFTLDLVEQCSFQKQRVMHLVMTSRDERLVSQAIELNEQLGRVLARHDALVTARPYSTSNHVDHTRPIFPSNLVEQEGAELEDEMEQLSRRIRKGKARLRQEDEDESLIDGPFGLLGSRIPDDKLHRPLIRPLAIDPPLPEPEPPLQTAPLVPPPPAKHVEREKFFQEKKGDATSLAGHVRALSLHSRNTSSGGGGSTDSGEYKN